LLLPIVPAFLEAYPKLSLEIIPDRTGDRPARTADRCCAPQRSAENSQLFARKLGAARMIIVGSPGYLARYGTPKTPDELAPA